MSTWRSGTRRGLRWASAALVAITCLGAVAEAQRGTAVRVIDDQGRPVSFAVVSWGSSNRAIADSGGRVDIPGMRGDSVRLHVRRIGHRPFDGFVKPGGDSTIEVILAAVARQLAAVTVTERSTPLSRTGFYDRVERVRRGAIVGEFFTPEELDERDQAKVSNLLRGSRYVRLGTTSARGRAQPVVLGRGGCGMTIVVDGIGVAGTVEQSIPEQTPGSIMNVGVRGAPAGSQGGGANGVTLDIDELVSGREVMAIEVYPSLANAPTELIPPSGRGSCGLVAIWTGPRK